MTARLAAFAAVAAALVSGCGGGSGDLLALEVVRRAGERASSGWW